MESTDEKTLYETIEMQKQQIENCNKIIEACYIRLQEVREWPKVGETFYYINADFEVACGFYTQSVAQEKLYKKGNMFKTEEDALLIASQINSLFEEK